MAKRLYAYLILLILCVGCGHSTGEVVKIIEERDSLKTVAARQGKYLDNLDELLTVVNTGLDSIASQEQLIFPSIGEGNLTKDQILAKVDGIGSLIASQRERIQKLETQIKKDSEDISGRQNDQLDQMITRFKQQLAQKDKEIADLKSELSKREIDLANMQKQIGQYTNKIAELDRKNNLQAAALERQDKILNQCYMLIATKDELTKAGIVKKGKLVAQGALDRSKFSQVDIRKFSELEFTAKRPRILTQMPENSFYVTTNGKNSYTLKITNPSEFWRVSNYLVIQTD